MTILASQIFGSDVSLDETTPSDPYLVIRLSNLEDIVNGGDITTGNGIDDVSLVTSLTLDEYASRIFMGLVLLHLQNQPLENTDDSDGTYVVFDPNFDKSFTTRNNISQIEYNYTVGAYTADSIPLLDPDNVVTN